MKKFLYFAIDAEHLESVTATYGGLNGLLDMLRYDAATVVDKHLGYWVFKTELPQVTFARWASFGIYVTRELHRGTNQYPLVDVLSELRRKQAEAREAVR